MNYLDERLSAALCARCAKPLWLDLLFVFLALAL